MKTTVIISVYKDVKALAIILSALQRQTYSSFDIIVSEDGECLEIKELIQQYNNTTIQQYNNTTIQQYNNTTIQQYNNTTIQITHLTQPDVGWRKNRALNRSVVNAKGDYLIFIDGDCIPHSKFVETHITLAHHKVILSGRRCDIGGNLITKLKDNVISLKELESLSFYFFNVRSLMKGSRALEDAIYIKPNSLISQYILPRISKIRGILGCNFSCFKQDLLNINGFDEDYTEANFGEDTDLEWRFEKINISIKSVRNMAILYHLRHPLNKTHFEKNRAIMLEKIKNGKHFCNNGIIKISP